MDESFPSYRPSRRYHNTNLSYERDLSPIKTKKKPESLLLHNNLSKEIKKSESKFLISKSDTLNKPDSKIRSLFLSATGSYLMYLYIFCIFHSCIQFIYPQFYTLLREPRPIHHPLLYMPIELNSLFGYFFTYFNDSVHDYMGFSICISISIMLVLHVTRFIVNRISWDQCISLLIRIFGVLSVTIIFSGIANIIFGGIPFKSIGIPDIYVGAVFKRGGLCGVDTIWDTLNEAIISSDVSSQALISSIDDIYNLNILDTYPTMLCYYHSMLETIAFFGCFILGCAIDIYGFYLHVLIIKRCVKWQDICIEFGILMAILGYASFNLSAIPSCNSKDAHWRDFSIDMESGDLNAPLSTIHHPILYSQYLTTSDGIDVAIDVYLPNTCRDLAFKIAKLDHSENGLKHLERLVDQVEFKSKTFILELLRFKLQDLKAQRHSLLKGDFKPLPTYMEVTRYNRRTQVYWPLTMIEIWGNTRGASVNVWSWQTQQALTANGYAVIIADTRGSGASFGSRNVDLGTREIQDATELSNWIKKQWFSNGRIGAGGISYDGMMGLSTAAKGGISAVLSLFSPIDVLGDLALPGGAVCISFISDYTSMTKDFESHGSPKKHLLKTPLQFPLHVSLGFLTFFGRVSAVLGQENRLDSAIHVHLQNWIMADVVHNLGFFDDMIEFGPNLKATGTSFGITKEVMEQLSRNNVAVYAVGGFCDSATARGAIQLYSHMQKHAPESGSRLILGSWNHGGRRSCNPYGGSFPCFENGLYLDIVRFFDCHVKGQCWGDMLDEAPVHYWLSGSEEWKASKVFPPISDLESKTMHLSHQHIEEYNDILSNHEKYHFMPLVALFYNRMDRFFTYATFEHLAHDIVQEFQITRELIHSALDYLWHNSMIFNNMFIYFEKLIFPLNTYHILAQRPFAYLMDISESPNLEYKKKITHSIFKGIKFPIYKKGWKNTMISNSINPNTLTRRHTIDFKSTLQYMKNSTPNHLKNIFIHYPVDYTVTSGGYSRWKIAQHPFRSAVYYGNRLFSQRNYTSKFDRFIPEQTVPHHKDKRLRFHVTDLSFLAHVYLQFKKHDTIDAQRYSNIHSELLSWTSPPLDRDISIVGSVVLDLKIYVHRCNDLPIFVYLEDIDLEKHFAHYVTEGHVMASHRPKQINYSQIGSSDFVQRTFEQDSYVSVKEEGELVHVILTLEPIGWTFKKGHSIRIVLSGSDTDNFQPVNNPNIRYPLDWIIYTPSARLILPVLNNNNN